MKTIVQIILVIQLCLLLKSTCAEEIDKSLGIDVIPRLQNYERLGNGKCGSIAFLQSSDSLSNFTSQQFLEAFNLQEQAQTNNVIRLAKDNNILPEVYEIRIQKENITVKAADEAGFFYALQTLKQLAETHNGLEYIPQLAINDNPRYKWRGLHFDESRHFFGADKVKQLLDWMAFYKLNRFHWHLVDDQGWRIEIKKYPKLTDVGGKRTETSGKSYGPYFYTQEEIREIVKYAADRHIEIIPEIELPGHVTSALAAYPELGCRKSTIEVGNTWGVYNDVYCAGNEEVFHFLEEVFTEVCDLFPGRYLHIGGDECPKQRWEKCALCQERIKKEKLKNEEELQSYFVERISKFLHKKGKTVIGWDEIMEGYTPGDAVIMAWHGKALGEIAIRNGHKTVMTPSKFLYLNKYQGDVEAEPLAMTGIVPLKKVYEFEPQPDGLTVEQNEMILGVQACLWSEHLYKSKDVDYMLMPRLLALSELAWTNPEKKNWLAFKRRLEKHYTLLDTRNVNYHINPPKGVGAHEVFTDSKTIKLKVSENENKILYRLDSGNWKEYKEPLEVHESAKLETYAQMVSGKKSITRCIELKKMEPLKPIEPENLKGEGFKVKWTQSITQCEFVDSVRVKSIEDARSVLETDEQAHIFVKTYLRVNETGIYEFHGHPDLLLLNNNIVMDCRNKSKRIQYKGQMALEKGWHKLDAIFFVMDYKAIPAEKVKTSLEWRKVGDDWKELKSNCYTE